MATQKLEIAKSALEQFQLSSDQIQKISQIFEQNVNYGLSSEESVRKQTILPMVKTFLSEIPTAKQKDRFIGVDLGGTNFRIILAEFNDGKINFVTETESVPKELYTSPCRYAYDFIASKISAFLKSRNLHEQTIKLGYTFSYPTVQESVKCAKLITWTHTFKCPDGVGEDAGKLLQDAIDRRQDCKAEVVCVLNDTTATLLTGAFDDPQCAIGVIVGTGSNAAYYESMDRLKSFGDAHFSEKRPEKMIIDIEWGCFGDDGALEFIKTKIDHEADRSSVHPGSFSFEKLFSGHFFGELCRLVLLQLARDGAFLNAPGAGPDSIPGAWGLSTAVLSPVNSDSEDGNFSATRAVLKQLGWLELCDEQDVKILHMVCRILTRRAADILAAVLASLVRHIGRPELTIAFDGSFYRCQPGLSQYIGEQLAILCPQSKVKLSLVHDGSGRGGALAAATL